jgi:hypothetical protein
MLYSIIDVADQTIKDRLAVTCDHQPFIASASLVLFFVADYQRLFDFYQFCDVDSACKEKGINPRTPAEGDMLLAFSDALIAAQTAVLAAESLGIGSCYIGDILENAEIHQKLFNLPKYTLPITLLVFGKPYSKNEGRVTSRYEQEFICYKNQYKRLSQEELIKMYEPTAKHTFPNLEIKEAVTKIGRQIYFRKFVSDFTQELNRSSKEWIDTWNKQD